MATTVERPVITEDISIHPPERLLFGPGPSQVHPRVYQALAQPIVGHLDAYFFEISTDIQRMLRKVFGTTNELTFVISATGSGGMETAISNFVTPGTKVVSFAMLSSYTARLAEVKICHRACRAGTSGLVSWNLRAPFPRPACWPRRRGHVRPRRRPTPSAPPARVAPRRRRAAKSLRYPRSWSAPDRRKKGRRRSTP